MNLRCRHRLVIFAGAPLLVLVLSRLSHSSVSSVPPSIHQQENLESEDLISLVPTYIIRVLPQGTFPVLLWSPFTMSSFPGERFLSVHLPDYEKERGQIVIKISIAAILFLIILPYFFATKRVQVDASTSSIKQLPSALHQPSNKRDKRNGKKERARLQPQNHEGANDTTPNGAVDTALEFSPMVSNVLTLMCIMSMFIIVFSSQNNLFPARTVLVAPLFTPDECQQIIDMAHAAAERNANGAQEERELLLKQNPGLTNPQKSTHAHTEFGNESSFADARPKLQSLDKILRRPPGWKKDRHDMYPTTDLNLVTDGFTDEDRAWLSQRLDARLAPLVERGFGIFRGAIRAADMFVVRYDAVDGGQRSLRKHTDGGHLSFNVLLNDGFEGGGTRYVCDCSVCAYLTCSNAHPELVNAFKCFRFHNRADKSYFDVNPSVGEVLVSNSQISHEGLATTSGTRYILVGFDSIDNQDPFTGKPTNLSLFSSWLNWGWMAVRFKEGNEVGRRTRNDASGGAILGNKYTLGLFSDLHNAMVSNVRQLVWIHIWMIGHNLCCLHTIRQSSQIGLQQPKFSKLYTPETHMSTSK